MAINDVVAILFIKFTVDFRLREGNKKPPNLFKRIKKAASYVVYEAMTYEIAVF